MVWQELSIRVPYEYVEPVSYLFSRYGHGLSMEKDGEKSGEKDREGTSDTGGRTAAWGDPDVDGEWDGIERVTLRTYLQHTSRQRLARIEVGLNLVGLLEPLEELTITPVPDMEDWQTQWRSHFDLLRVGSRLVIKPTWIAYEPTGDDVVIELDPGMAFGTGYHPTTYTCLEALEDLVQPGMKVLDLGTGSGILSITAVRLGASEVVALDIDPQAVRAARQNFRRTRVQRQVSLTQGTVPHPLAGEGYFDVVAANISARAVAERAPFIAPTLKPGGVLIASGIMLDQQAVVEESLTGLGLSLEKTWTRDDWITLGYRMPEVI